MYWSICSLVCHEFVFVLVTSFTLKSLFYSFNHLFIHECWHLAFISIHPSHLSICPSIHPSTAYACAYLPTVYYLSFCIQIFIRPIPDFAHTTCLIDLSIDYWSICSLFFHEFVFVFVPFFPWKWISWFSYWLIISNMFSSSSAYLHTFVPRWFELAGAMRSRSTSTTGEWISVDSSKLSEL